MVWNGDELIEWEMDINSPVYQNMRKWFGELIAKEIEDKCVCSWECICGAIDMAFIARGQK